MLTYFLFEGTAMLRSELALSFAYCHLTFLCFSSNQEIGLCLRLTLATTSSNPIGNDSNADIDSYYPAQEWSDTFDWKLLKAFSTPEYKNVLISPVALKLVLSLLYEGSSGMTEKEFQQVLQFVEKKDVRERFLKIIESLQPGNNDDYKLNLGTRIFLDSEITAQQNYNAKANHYYHTNVTSTNFSRPDEASTTINSWIHDLTEGKVPKLVNAGDLENAIMILANAIYFKGTWRHQFPRNQTVVGGFYVSPTESVMVPYMTTTDTFYFFESSQLDAKILRLPYKGNIYSLFIVLPNSKGGLSDLIKKINLHNLKRELYFMDPFNVEVALPKFKFNFQARFNKVLQDLGLRQMFENTASFPGIARGVPDILRKLVVSDVIQKTGIELDEEGSVVYSATEVQVGNKFGEADNLFNASHPFLFFIEEQIGGSILFVGKVENPLEVSPVPLPPRFGDEAADQDVRPQTVANVPNLQPVNPETDAILKRFNYFDLELLKEYSEARENVFISPASIKTTLGLILEGAKGRSAQEIVNALRIENFNRDQVRKILKPLLFSLSDASKNTVLEAASGVFLSNKYSRVLPEYEEILGDYYGAFIKKLDFSKANEAAAVINSWAYNATRGLIPEIVSLETFAGETSVVLANALYFKGKWKTSFDPKYTKVKCFTSPTRGCVNTPFMQVSETFEYNFIVDLNAHAIDLPYQDDKYSMLILLPESGHEIGTLARDMQHARFNEILNVLRPYEIILEVPKFDIEFHTELISYLAPLKVREIFSPKANLTGIVGDGNLRISSIVQKTKIEVNEQGTRAAAATSAIVIPLMGSSAQRIQANHPFIFFIYHKESKNIIFEGILVEPVDVAPVAPVQKSRIAFYPQPYPQ